MRILCVTPWFPAIPGAQSGNFILDSVNAIEALGHSVKVLVVHPWHPGWAAWLHPDWGRPRLCPEAHSASLGVEEVKHFSIPRNYLRCISNWVLARFVVPAIEKVAASFKPDVILVHTESVGAAGVEVGKRMGIPVSVVLHGISTSARLNTPAQRDFVGKALAAAGRVILVGEPLMAHFASIAGGTRNFRIVHNGCRLPPFAEASDYSGWGNRLRFISVSNLHEGKGIDLNLLALGKLQRQGQRRWSYTVVGDGRERVALEALAMELGISDSVRFVGAISHDEVYAHLAMADVFVLPSYREAFGVAYVEAMATGLLTIGVRGQGPQAFIRDGETGLLVEPNDVVSLGSCLSRVFENPGKMQAIAVAGRNAVRSEFTWARHADKVLEVLKELVVSEHERKQSPVDLH